MKENGMNQIRKKITAIMMIIMLVITFIPSYGVDAEEGDNAGNSGLTVSNFAVMKKGNDGNYYELTDDTDIRNNEQIKIVFDWEISNTDGVTSSFEYEFAPIQNLNISNVPAMPLINRTGDTIGSYEIKDGKLLINLLPDYISNGSEKRGGADIAGTVKFDSKPEYGDVKIPITIADKTYNVNYHSEEPASHVEVTKEASGGIEVFANGYPYRQKFVVTISAKDGPVTLIAIEDYTKSNSIFSTLEINSIKILPETTVDFYQRPERFVNFDHLWAFLHPDYGNTQLQNPVIFEEGDVLKFEYYMQMKYDIINPNVPYGAYDTSNTFNVVYTDNKGKTQQEKSTVDIDYPEQPEIFKEGSVDYEKQAIDYTITIKMNGYWDPRYATLEDYLSKSYGDMSDLIPGWSSDDSLNGWISIEDKFTPVDQKKGVFTYTYSVPVSDSAWESAIKYGSTLNNTVELRLLSTQNVYRVTEEVGIEDRVDFDKTVLEYDGEDNTILWAITIGEIPADVSDITLTDLTNQTSYINGKAVSNRADHTLVEDIDVQVGDTGERIHAVLDGTVVAENGAVTDYSDGKLTFDREFISQNSAQNIKVYLKTTPGQDGILPDKTYYNRAVLELVSDEGAVRTVPAEDTYTRKSAVSKSYGSVTSSTHVDIMGYTIGVHFADIYNFGVGDIELLDEYSDNMEIVPDSLTVLLSGKGSVNVDVKVSIETIEDGRIRFRIPVTADLVEAYKQGAVTGLVVEYDMKLKDSKKFLEDGIAVQLRNTVTGTFNGVPIGEKTTNVTRTPSNAVSKTCTYTKATAPYVNYQITVNYDGLDLSDNMLEAVDVLGPDSALIYDLDSIVVSKWVGNKWIEITSPDDYTYTYDAEENAIRFKLPDSLRLRITYRAKVNLPYSKDGSENGTLTADNSKNGFMLSGLTGNKTETEKYVAGTVITPNVWAVSETGSVTIHKYWNSSEGMTALPGSKFKIVLVSYNEATGELVEGLTARSNIEVDENGIYEVKNLLKDQIYALYETEAGENFYVRTDPYYFVIKGSSDVKIPDNKEITVFNTGDKNDILFENQPKTGKLIITKTVKGDVTREEAEGTLVFEVTDNSSNQSVAYTLADFTYNAGEGRYVLELEQVIGGYTVTEKIKDIDGYKRKSVTYSVDGGTAREGDTVDVTITDQAVVTIDYIDDYEKITTATTEDTETTATTEKTETTVTTEKTETTVTTENTEGSTATIITTETNTDQGTHKTGDDSNLLLAIVFVLISGAGAAFAYAGRKKNR